jgi:FIMAH domain
VQSGCALAGPTSFTPASGSVTVPAGQCATIPTTIARAANMRQTGSAGCYQMTVQVPGTAETFRCRGSIVDGASLCWHFPDPGAVLTDHTEGIVRFTATNTSSSPFTLDYEAIVLDQLLAPDTRAVSLDDQLPGAPIHGHLDLQPGASERPEVQARFVAPDPTHTYTLLVQADTHGNGKLEPVAAASLRSVIQPSCVTDLYGVDDAGRLVAVSRDTFTERPLGRIGFATVKALAYDAGADTLYGLTANGALLVIDRETGSGRLLARLNLAGAGAVLPGLAFAVDAGVKRLYAVTAPGVLYRIDLVPGYPATRLGSTVFESHQALVVGLAFEPSTGTLYGVDRNSDALVILDKTTGAVLRTLPNSELLYPQGLAFDPATGTLFGTHDSGVLATYELSSGIASFAATTGITGGFITGGLTFAPRPRGQVLLQALRFDVKLLVASAALTEEQGDQLTRTLLSATHQLSSGDIELASARLRRFTRQVRKLMHAGILSHADGRALIARAGSLLANPSC